MDFGILEDVYVNLPLQIILISSIQRLRFWVCLFICLSVVEITPIVMGDLYEFFYIGKAQTKKEWITFWGNIQTLFWIPQKSQMSGRHPHPPPPPPPLCLHSRFFFLFIILSLFQHIQTIEVYLISNMYFYCVKPTH